MSLTQAKRGLEALGIEGTAAQHWNLNTPLLYEQAIRGNEGLVAHMGPLVVSTGERTGRSPNDKFVVKEPSSESTLWWGKVNKPFESEKFEALLKKMTTHAKGRQLFVQDLYAGADARYRLNVRVVTEQAWHSLFVRNLFIRPSREELVQFEPGFTILQMPSYEADPKRDGTHSKAFIILHMGKRLVLIGGTHYAGEMKKSMFTVMNYMLPNQGVMSMHCSANIGGDKNTALFFGLSGTGKTTLSADPTRTLIGDDEHGWSNEGVFNIEGGCYAKVIRLSKEAEPEIFQTTRRFGTILENVVMDKETRRLDLNSDAITENTRAAYPISFISNATLDGVGGHPKDIFMLTADAFGVLPPISRLTADQAMYHFISGYTAKVAGTEQGVKEPLATFSACFGAPFLTFHPHVYAKLFGEKIHKHKVRVWLLNTGWTGGPYGIGHRMSISHTRALLRAALTGQLDSVPMQKDPIFGVEVPTKCEGVPADVLTPRKTWKDPTAYDQMAKTMAEKFKGNFKQYETEVSPEVRSAGPPSPK